MKKFLVLLGVVLLAVAAPYGMAQVNTASVSGSVQDAQGAVIPGATVTIHHKATGVDTTVMTNKDGFYSVQNLPIGEISLKVTAAGFQTYERQGVTLTTAQVLELDAKLNVGGGSTTVEVTTEAPLVETRSSTVTQFIESRTVDSLPLGNRRTMNVMQTIGGAVYLNDNPGGSQPTYSLAGGRVQSQMTWLDGGLTQNFRIAAPQQSIDPPIEVIKEVQVLVSTYPAQYGASGGGVVIESSKSGTNRLHGSAYEYLRNDAADAAGYFAPQLANGKPNRPKDQYNVFGATVGGPIKTNKIFFFFGYEGVRWNNGKTLNLTVPSVAMRSGNFSELYGTATPIVDPVTHATYVNPCDGRAVNKGQLFNPSTQRTVGGVVCRDEYVNNQIPLTTDAVGNNILQDYPVPQSGTSFFGNYINITHTNFLFGKVEANLTPKDYIQGRYMYYRNTIDDTTVYPNRGADPTQFPNGSTTMLYATSNHTFDDSKVNNAGFSFYRRLATSYSFSYNKNYPQQLGLSGVPQASFPGVSPAGYQAIGTGSQGNGNVITQEQVTDDFTWLKGKHALKMGGEYRGSRSNGNQVLATSSGSFGFATQTTGFIIPDGATAGAAIVTNTGNGAASLLSGSPGGASGAFSISNGLPVDRHSQYVGAYLQDDWKVNKQLTLNLGLRWEWDRPIYDGNNRLSSFDPNETNPVSGTPGVIKFAGIDYPREAYDPNYKNFSPRLGFAFKPFPNENTVVRGGYGIYFGPPIDNTSWGGGTLGYVSSTTVNSPDQIGTPVFFLRNGVPSYTLASPALNDSFGAVAAPYTTPTTAVPYFPRSRPTEYNEQFNLTLEHQFTQTIVISLTGLGNLGRRLSSANQAINQITPANVAAGHTTQAYRPFPQFSNVTLIAPTIGLSNYFGGIIKVEKRYSHGLNFVSTYTWSKLLADTNDNANSSAGNLGQDNGPYSNLYDRSADYGRTDNDVERRFTFNTVYELPFGVHRRWSSRNAVVNAIIGGWSISDLTTVQSGAAETVVDTTNNCNCFSSGSQRPNLSGDPKLGRGQRGISTGRPWFNTALFSQPAAGTFGNERVGVIDAPGLVDFDMSVLRTVSFPAGFRLELRLDAFDVFNHTNLAPANTSFGSAAFGTVTSTSGTGSGLRTLQAGVKISF